MRVTSWYRTIGLWPTCRHPFGLLTLSCVRAMGAPRTRPYSTSHHPFKGIEDMLMTIVVILVVLWLLGMITSFTMGGLIHILLVIAVVVVLVRVIQGRNPL